MSISKNVIRDLLPVFAAGEASEETQALVAEACAGDAELLAEVEQLGTVRLPEAPPPAGIGVTSLRRTQRLLRQRTVMVGFSFFFMALTFAFAWRSDGIWMGIPMFKVAATASLLTAMGGWVAFLRNAARLRDTGLQPLHSHGPQIAWMLAAWCFLTALAVVLWDWTHWELLTRHGVVLTCLAPIFVEVGRRLKQLRPAEELVVPVETLLTLAHQEEQRRQDD